MAHTHVLCEKMTSIKSQYSLLLTLTLPYCANIERIYCKMKHLTNFFIIRNNIILIYSLERVRY